jgi:hypothetical protein
MVKFAAVTVLNKIASLNVIVRLVVCVADVLDADGTELKNSGAVVSAVGS